MTFQKPSGGWIEVICGSMFSGKTEELIRRLRRASIAQQAVQVFKPAIDDRYDVDNLVSHSGLDFQAVPINMANEIIKLLQPDTTVVGIDEAQFFDDDLVVVCVQLAEEGLRVIVAGLDMDFRKEPFGPVPMLMAQAESVDKLTAICVCCGGPASFTQRMIDGEPASFDDPQIVVGASEKYEARCRGCHEVPR